MPRKQAYFVVTEMCSANRTGMTSYALANLAFIKWVTLREEERRGRKTRRKKTRGKDEGEGRGGRTRRCKQALDDVIRTN